jgi:hypothetical protein
MWLWIPLIALAVWATARTFLGYPPRDPALSQLAPREAAFVTAAADAAFPAGGAIPPSGSEAGIPRHLDRYLGLLGGRNRVLIRLLLAFFEHATLLFPAPGASGFRRFSALSPAQRVAVLDAWSRSPLRARRLVFTSLRTILTMGYFDSPAVLRATGLAPLAIETPVVAADLLFPRIGQARASIRLGPEDLARPVPRAPLDPHGPLDPAYVEARHCELDGGRR